MTDRRFRAVVLDLFDTIVRWEPARLPTIELRGREMRSTLPLLEPILRATFGEDVAVPEFADAYQQVIEEVRAVRERDGVEVTCEERFRRTIERIGHPAANGVESAARALTRAHMAAVRAATSAPPAHVAVVRWLADRYRLGLCSNFDDSETARQILADTGAAECFDVVIVSADLMLRKPHPKIFATLLASLGLEAKDVLFVGDTPREDVTGAQGAGIPVAWLSEGKPALPEDIPPPEYTLKDLTELPAALSD